MSSPVSTHEDPTADLTVKSTTCGMCAFNCPASAHVNDAGRIVKVDGRFEFGSAVRILDEKDREIARGLVNYNSRDLDQIKGMKSAAVRSLVGQNFYDEVIHRDDLVLV